MLLIARDELLMILAYRYEYCIVPCITRTVLVLVLFRKSCQYSYKTRSNTVLNMSSYGTFVLLEDMALLSEDRCILMYLSLDPVLCDSTVDECDCW